MADDDLTVSEDEPLSLPPEPAGAGKEDEPLSLVDSEGGGSAVALKAFGAGMGQSQKEQQYKRALNVTGQGATRCRVFHSKIAEAPLEYMQNQINEWLDSDQIEVKHVGHVIGTLEGKTPVPNVIVMVWY